MQYAVPQFIDAEDKLIGPFTLKQFGIVFAAGVFDVIVFKLFGVGFILFLFGLPVTLAGLGFAFVPFNGRHLYQMVPLFISFLTKPKIYIFQHTAPSVASMHLQKQPQASATPAAAPLESPQSALKRLSLTLDQRHADATETAISGAEPLPNAAQRSTHGA